jgi:hypothetical protein
MIKNLLYKFKTRNYFNPKESIEVNEEDFMKILRGEVFNPHFPNADYAYMVVGASKKSPLNSWAGQEWGSNGYENAHEEALWYGKFAIEHGGRIVIPFSSRQIDFNPCSQFRWARFRVSEFDVFPWRGGGFMQVDKDIFSRTLVSNLNIDAMEDLVGQVYSGHKAEPLFGGRK